jgi:malonyl-CoA O-methyltransferase
MRTPDAILVDTRHGYDRWSEVYDDEDNPLVMLEEPLVRALLGECRGRRVADVGCGTGRHSAWLAQRGARVTGFDFSEGMLALARRKSQIGRGGRGAERIHLVQHDVTRPLPATDAAFDHVISCLVIDHIPDLPAFFAELARICRADGRITLSTMHPAMMLKGVQARFHDPRTQQAICPASCAHQVSDYVLAAVRARLPIVHMSEHLMDEATASRAPRAAKYAGWPVLLLMQLLPRA